MKRQMQGFTLIEAMVVLIIVAIILGFGIPSFANLIEKMSTESAAKTIIEGLRTARVVAIEEKQNVVVCSSSDGSNCNGTWDDGFIVFRDNNDNHSLNAGEEILFHHAFKSSILVKIGSGTNYKVYFNSNGWTPGSADSILVCAKADTNQNGFRIAINRAGRLRVEDSTITWVNSSNKELGC